MVKAGKVYILFIIMAVCGAVIRPVLAEDYYNDDSDREKAIDRFHEQQVKTFGPSYVRQAAYNAKADYGMSNRVKFLSDVAQNNRPVLNKQEKESVSESRMSENYAPSQPVTADKRISVLTSSLYGEDSLRLPKAISDYIEKIRSSDGRSIDGYRVLASDDKYVVFTENTNRKDTGDTTKSVSMQTLDSKGNVLGKERVIVSERKLDSLTIEGVGLITDRNIAIIRSEAVSIDEGAENNRIILSICGMNGEEVLNDMVINNLMMRLDGLQTNLNMITEPGRVIISWMELSPDGGDYVIKEVDIPLSGEDNKANAKQS